MSVPSGEWRLAEVPRLTSEREKELRAQANPRANPSLGFVGSWLRILLAEIDRLRAEPTNLAAEVAQLRQLLRERHEFPEYPIPDNGEVATQETFTERELWNEKWEALATRIEAALGVSRPVQGEETEQ